MGSEEEAAAFFAKYGLGDVARVSDPEKRVYEAFGLERGSLGELFGLRVIGRALAALFRGHGVGKPVGDPRQMPGAFLVVEGEIVASYRHRDVAARPDYAELASSASAAGMPERKEG